MSEMNNLIDRLAKAASTIDAHDGNGVFLKTELTALSEQFSAEHNKILTELEDAQAANHVYRKALEDVRQTARKVEDDNAFLIPVDRVVYILDLMGSVAYVAQETLKNTRLGEEERRNQRRLDALVCRFEDEMQQDSGWRYGHDRTMMERVSRIVQYYQEYAARIAEAALKEKQSTIVWLRGIAINAQSVSWASTHNEKDARLRGMIEVIEKAISSIQDVSVGDYSQWDGAVDSWTRSDFPTRHLKRRIFDLESEIKRLNADKNEHVKVSDHDLF